MNFQYHQNMLTAKCCYSFRNCNEKSSYLRIGDMERVPHNSLGDDHRHLRNHPNLLELLGKLEACSHWADMTHGWYLTPLENHYMRKCYQIITEFFEATPRYDNIGILIMNLNLSCIVDLRHSILVQYSAQLAGKFFSLKMAYLFLNCCLWRNNKIMHKTPLDYLT